MTRDMKREKIKEKIRTKRDYIHCPRLSNSLVKLLNLYPEGIEDKKICDMLLVDEEELEQITNSALTKLRAALDFDIRKD